ncbi:MAG: RNA polymerase sigma factor [Candidatus Paceibacterota bacterium]|jgi:RNA polymerase sigma-70 factor (ECF subfamily)
MDSNTRQIKKIFEKAYAENTDALFRFALYRVSDREIAIDIVEDAYVRFWQTLEKEEVKEPRAFLFKLTRNLIIDWYRKRKSVPIQDFSEGGAEGERAEIFMDMFEGNIPGADVDLEARLLVEKIRELEPIYREAVYLRYVEELSPKEISAITGEPTNLISVRINRGLKLLKAALHI